MKPALKLALTLLAGLAFANLCFADADASSPLRRAVARILEQHGIAANTALDRAEAPARTAAAAETAGASFAADLPAPLSAQGDAAAAAPASDIVGLVVRFADASAAEYAAANAAPPTHLLNALLDAADSLALEFVRPMSLGRFVFRFDEPISAAAYAELAATLYSLDLVESVYADELVAAQLHPDDSYFPYQWSLMQRGDFSERTNSTVIGMNAVQAWDLVHEDHSIVVAVVDTGMTTPTPIPAARILPGYDFISEPSRARDSDGRDPDPADAGDWREAYQCVDFPDKRNSTWHGAGMSSLIAAPGNDDSGIAGVDWKARILPVRALGLCGGQVSDIVDGILWAAGLSVPGVPDNEYPARIINLSLGRISPGPCHPIYQEAFDILGDMGVISVAAAGNENDEAALNKPSNCLGPISVAAVDHQGQRASYSNYSDFGYIDIAAPGGDQARYGLNSGLVAVADKGSTKPSGESRIYWTGGTSAATAHVSGAMSLALRLDPLQHVDLLVSLLLETAQPFGKDSECETAYPRCGVGIVDIEALIQGALVFKDYAVVRDFYHEDLDHYFRSGNWDEVSQVTRGKFGEWEEGEDLFLAWRDGSPLGTHPVCRFYGTPGIGPNSHFYTVDAKECEFVKQNDPGWTYEGTAFYAKKPNSIGACPRNTRKLYRYYNQRAHLNDSNHRYTTTLDDREAMEAAGWFMEGVAMCVPK